MELLHEMGIEVVDHQDPDTAEEEVSASEGGKYEETEDLVAGLFPLDGEYFNTEKG